MPGIFDVLKTWIPRHIVTPRFLGTLSARAKARGTQDAEELWRALQGDVTSLMQEALSEGLTPPVFKERLAGVLTQYGVGKTVMPDGLAADASAWYADLVYRQTAANAAAEGRDMALWDPEWVERAPYWRFLAIRDSRNDEPEECPDLCCRTLHNLVFAKEDLIAQRFLPPIHFQCRCEAQELTSAEVKRRGLVIVSGASVSVSPAPGFGGRRAAA